MRQCLTTVPILLLGWLLLGPWLALPAPAQAQSIRRCVDADGVTVFTDKPCELVQARPRLAAQAQAPVTLSAGRASLGAQSGRQCPQRLSELVDEIQLAIQSGDVNRLSALYWWAGHGNASASRLLERLEAMAARPLVDIAPVYPELAPPSEPAQPQWLEVGDSGSAAASGAGTAAPVVAATTRPPRPYALRVEQVLANSATPSRSILRLRRQYGCFWISF